MADETTRLARYAASLRYDDLPPDVVDRARACIVDTIAVVTLGRTLPWSQIVIRYARSMGAGGPCQILGAEGPTVSAPAAALANGAMARWRMRSSPII